MRPLIPGVAGGRGSGKTTVARAIVPAIGPDRVSVIHHDSYYRDQSDIPLEERALRNYDHPDALETPLLVHHLQELLAGRPVQVPVYDFTSHARSPETRTVQPRKVIIVDGILILYEPELRALMDIKVFVRSEERRVGKECRSRWWRYHKK